MTASKGRQIDHIVVTVHDLDKAGRVYGELGFTLTPRAQHPWGTANRLAQFQGNNFIELLEIDRPSLIFEHDAAAQPPVFSFGAFNRGFLSDSEGISMLVLAGEDSAADVERFRMAGLDTYAPFDFERAAPLPDGGAGKVAFSLAFATHPTMRRAAFFTCHNRYPETFWKPAFQSHENGALAISEVVMVAEEPMPYASFLAGFSGGTVDQSDDNISVSCGPHVLTVLSPSAAERRYPGHAIDLTMGPRLLGVVIEGNLTSPTATAAAEACGVIIEWRFRALTVDG